jgi:branched-subunit amino acid aminotransferase/4-amino-4-deoxychorismate lyase
LRLTVSPFLVNSTSPLAGVKSCNYLENLLSLEEAERRGFDEAIRLNEKQEIVSAGAANVFWIKNKKIHTPALETGCLAGTTREFLSENIAVHEVKSRLNEIIEADEVFLTSAGIGVCPADFGNVKKSNISMIPKLKKFLT